ncbi:unnamed protein product [Urochloa humidicola]
MDIKLQPGTSWSHTARQSFTFLSRLLGSGDRVRSRRPSRYPASSSLTGSSSLASDQIRDASSPSRSTAPGESSAPAPIIFSPPVSPQGTCAAAMASPPKTTDGETEHLDRRICVSGAPAHPLEDTNILPEILLRLPPLPSSLFHASPVCKHWGHVVSDPHFHRRFRAHHKKPPVLGFFLVDHHGRDIVFRPAMNAPNHIPAAHFSLRLEDGTMILGCRHGRLLALNQTGRYFVVWDPITHYGKPNVCRVPDALGKGGKTLGKGFAECDTRQRRLGNGRLGKDVLCRVSSFERSAKSLPCV